MNDPSDGWDLTSDGHESYRPAVNPDQMWWITPAPDGFMLRLLSVDEGQVLREIDVGDVEDAKDLAAEIDFENG